MSIAIFTEILQHNKLFQQWPHTELQALAEDLSSQEYKLGEVIVAQGQEADAFYLVASGKVRLVDESQEGKPVTLEMLEAGESFGEDYLIQPQSAPYTAKASGKVTLLRLPHEHFQRLMTTHPHFQAQLEARLQRKNKLKFLKSMQGLALLNAADTQELLDRIETIQLPKGQFLFHEGESGDAAYIIASGKLRIIKESQENAVLALLKPGALIGDMALIHHQPRSAAALAVSETSLLRLSREVFEWALSRHEEIRETLTKQAGKRLLQQQTLLAASEGPKKRSRPSLQTRWQAVRIGWKPRRLAFTRAKTPDLVGLACLEMINRVYQQPRLPQYLLEAQVDYGQPDTLESLACKAEKLGYLTRMITLDKAHLQTPHLPAIVKGSYGQLLVVYEVTPTHVIVAKPLKGLERVSREAFLKSWNGQMLTLSYAPPLSESTSGQMSGLSQRFWPMIRPYRGLLGAILLISFLVQGLALIAPLFNKLIVDKVLVHADHSLFFLMLLSLLAVALFQIVGGAFRQFLMLHVLKRLSVGLLLRFFTHLFALPQKAFAQWSLGELTLRFQEHEKLLDLVAQSGFKILVDSLTLVGYLGVLFWLNGPLAWVTLGFLLAYVMMMSLAAPILHAHKQRIFEHNTQAESHLIAVLSGIQTVKAMAREPLFFKEGLETFTQAKHTAFEGAAFQFYLNLTAQLLTLSSGIVILGYGAQLTLRDELTMGELLAFQAILGLMLVALQGLVGVWDELQAMRLSFERLNDIFLQTREKQDLAEALPPLDGHVYLEEVSFRYQPEGPEVLTDITLEIQAGQKIAIVGRSGSGKSTLAQLLTRLLEPNNGKIYLDHRDIANVELSSLRQQIGVVEQQPLLLGGTIRENIALSNPEAEMETVVAAAMMSGAHEFIQNLPLRYETRVGEGGLALSGGQVQRIVVARALLNNPRLLILDEATSALDTESERILQQNLDELFADRTVLIIAHRLSTIRNADKIVVMDRGRIVETGTHEQLMEKQGLYFYLHTKASA